MFLDLFLVFVGVCWVGFCFSSFSLVLEVDRFLFLIVSVSFFCLEVEGMFFDLSVGVSCTLGIIVLRVLISSCRSFIKFVNSSSIFIVFICVFASFSTWFEGVLVTWEKVNLLKGFSISLLASGKVMFLVIFILIISFSLSQILQFFESALWFPLQLLQFKLFLQDSSIWFGSCSPHLTHTCFLVQCSFRCPYFWQLWHLLGLGIYVSTLTTV